MDVEKNDTQLFPGVLVEHADHAEWGLGLVYGRRAGLYIFWTLHDDPAPLHCRPDCNRLKIVYRPLPVR